MTEWQKKAGLAAIALAFVLMAIPFARHLGLQADEALIGNGIYERGAPLYSWKFGDAEIPVMILSYVGALKTWIFDGLWSIVTPSAFSLRLPMIFAGAVAIWLFFLLLDRTVGRVAAWIGTLLLATDSSFLLLEATDFGYVALQFLFKLGAILLLLRFHDTGRRWALAAAFFLLGLALWDKAVFLWVLFGLGVAALAVFPREIRRHLTLPNLAIGTVALIMGAAPLIAYNIARPLETIRSNAKVANDRIPVKATILMRTLEGYVMFGFLTSDNAGPQPGQPANFHQRLAFRLSRLLHSPQHNLNLIAFGLAVLALPLSWGTAARRPMLFGVVYLIATWIPMALTSGAGAAAHHVILLWPFHFFVIAAALSQVPWRAAAAVTIGLCAVNLAVTDQYYVDLLRNGGAIRFSSAIDRLNAELPRIPTRHFFAGDWGYLECVNVLSQGATPLQSLDMSNPGWLRSVVSEPSNVFVMHTPEFTFVPGVREQLDEQARLAGAHEVPIETINDENGRPTFDIFRFERPR